MRRPPRSTRTDTLFPYTTLFRTLLRQDCNGCGLRLPPPPLAVTLGLDPRAHGRVWRSACHRPRLALAHARLAGVTAVRLGHEPRGDRCASGARLDERRGGQGVVSTCNYRWVPYQ